MEKTHKIIGTAGHIDHGKTCLVKALTGTDTDRLKEEKERGLTIDLGFAFLSDDVAIIDVPGHEKFIRNMVAGVVGIEMALLVIAADDGIMPQTREHFDILRLLGIKKGIVVINKIDLVDEEWLELVEQDIEELVKDTFLENAPVFKVSSVTGEGIAELKQAIFDEIAGIEKKDYGKPFRLPIDRSFTIKGFGTVVTGTVFSGTIKTSAKVELLPQKKELRIRGIETHGKKVEETRAGDRAALNLSHIEKDEIERGEVLAEPGFFRPVYKIDCKLRLLKSAARPLSNRARVRIHIGTKEGMGRVYFFDRDELMPGEEAFIQLKTEVPFITSREDKFIIRQYTPIITIGGGEILDPYPFRKEKEPDKTTAYLKTLEQKNLPEMVKAVLKKNRWKAVTGHNLAAKLGISQSSIQDILTPLQEENQTVKFIEEQNVYWMDNSEFDSLKKSLTEEIRKFHEKLPLKKGINKVDLTKLFSKKSNPPAYQGALDSLAAGNKITEKEGIISSSDFKVSIETEIVKLRDCIESFILSGKFEGKTLAEIAEHVRRKESEVKEMLGLLLDEKKIAFIDNSMYIHMQSLEEAQETAKNLFKTKQDITVSEFRKALGVSRKYALPILIYFDHIKFTGRMGDTRILL